ncbi:TraX family protein [Bifidobacterium avesanii]|uniref:TraX family protein n=1 Tax=Bifidobacterium avesanii TaxID=1798157 RepID=UPI001F0D42F5|nr:TraX family protein [Bifidobacterium avesanii]
MIAMKVRLQHIPLIAGNGLTGFDLKIIACVIMVIDHIGMFIPHMPVEMRWVGRMAMPVFMFLIGQGMEHTRDRKRYMLRLYLAGVVMSLLQVALQIPNNIFPTLLQIAIIIDIISKQSNKAKIWRIALYCLWQVVCDALYYYAIYNTDNAVLSYYSPVLFALFNFGPFEYGYGFIIMGVLFWLYGKSKLGIALSFSIFTISYVLMMNNRYLLNFLLDTVWFDYHSYWYYITYQMASVVGMHPMVMGRSLMEYPQWMMIASLPLLLLYNGRRGAGGGAAKWFFYVFYPVHIAMLFAIGRLLD